ncbi:S8 family serine peptidase [Paenibacillus sp. GCM10027626]|uniref:S8 family serine peptidase n=1 Tax=Paenibacillus sp. GCM10027626 TaxID=3273411 RepID=UPI00364596B6
MKSIYLKRTALAVLVLVIGLFFQSTGKEGELWRGAAAAEQAGSPSWLLKWRDSEQTVPLPQTTIVHQQPETGIAVVRPSGTGVDAALWLKRLQALEQVEYVHPNNRVTLLAASSVPNDPELPKQHYLDQIGAKAAWTVVHDQTDLTIALVDTGVDLQHPDLKDNLVAGTNLVAPGKPPKDDNGHGTGVAGVLAAVGNNGKGVSGILWKAKIMPIKALDADGYGDEEKLGDAILYAIKNKARIVVLSVGLYRYSPYLEDVARYAENKGVLLVAATGNDGEKLGDLVEVKYPAAYPTVLAVSGATPDNKPEPRANSGPEVDLAAPWNVYTTAMGGGYKKEQGTSLAAPQAAAAAALVWSIHPEYKPYQIREVLRQSAKDIGPPGIDHATGYGLLQVGKAVTLNMKADGYEPNETRSAAKKIPIGTMISAQLTGGADRDWFAVDVPFDGKLVLELGTAGKEGNVKLAHFAGARQQSVKQMKIGNQTAEWNVKKGRNYILLQLSDGYSKDELPYLLTVKFKHLPDAYESNDKMEEAYELEPRSQTLTANFHQTGDRDWFKIEFKQSGTLQVRVTPDSVRIDPALAIGRAGEALIQTDENKEGEPEISREIAVTPGIYYIRVHDAISSKASPTIAQYELKLEYQKKLIDPNEPNDKPHESTVIRLGSTYSGVISTRGDEDWFQVRLAKQSAAKIAITEIPEGVRMKAELYDKRQSLQEALTSKGRTLAGERKLEAGLYYIKVTASVPFDKQYYKLRVQAEPLIAGFRDIAGTWAERPIAELSRRGIVSQSLDWRFYPARSITRAEVVAMLVRARNSPASGKSISFKDVPDKHWARDVIAKAVNAGWASGYVDGSFRPEKAITREEMSVMLARAFQLKVEKLNSAPFTDIPLTRWSAAELAAMKRLKWISGYSGNLFKPEVIATRAEFAALLQKALD